MAGSRLPRLVPVSDWLIFVLVVSATIFPFWDIPIFCLCESDLGIPIPENSEKKQLDEENLKIIMDKIKIAKNIKKTFSVEHKEEF